MLQYSVGHATERAVRNALHNMQSVTWAGIHAMASHQDVCSSQMGEAYRIVLLAVTGLC